MNTDSFEKIINEAWNNKSQVNSKSNKKIVNAISKTIDLLDTGKIRVAENKNNEWFVNQWIKKAILLSFRINKMKTSKGPYATWYDKVEGKTKGWNEKRFIKEGFRYVPNGVVRKGAYIAKNVVLMPSFVNIGAYVDKGSMIDYGLIRDVLLHPDQYQQLLYDAYEMAYSDGILTNEELTELSAIARVLQVPERTAARMATRAAIQSALADDHVSEAELDLIVGAARPLGLSEEELERIVEALRDHHLDEEERKMLDTLLGQIPDDEGPYEDYDVNEEE